MEAIIEAVTNATLFRPDLLTGDAINAMAGGHGMLNLSVFCTANVIADKILKGEGLKLKALNQERIDLNSVIDEGVKAAMATGSDPSNAALITASLCYLAGSNVRAGVPSGNRKLGAMCRLSAGAQRGGVLSLPTPKGGNKISAFPAVLKIYEAMMEGKLTRVNGSEVPAGILGTPLSGHSTLGEDYIFSEVAENAAAIGASAMMKAYAGAGMKPNPFISAVFGTAAALEICHPDAAMPERFGPSFKVYTPYVAGFGAVKATGLPENLHFRVTGEEFNTANLIGDLGIILKDMGTPTIIGMLAFYEIFACFTENAIIGTGSSGGPKTAPIGHVAADVGLALRTIAKTGSIEKAAEVIEKNKHGFFDPELASMEANTIARKVEELRGGPVSRAVILATTAVTKRAIAERVKVTYEGLDKGKTLTEIIISLEEKRIRKVEENVSAIMSKNLNKKIEIRITKITGGARRQGKISKKYFALDPNVDVEVRIDGKETILKNFCHEVIPDAVLNKKQDILQLLPIVSPAVGELLVTGHTLVDLVVPVATAVVLGKGSPEDLSEEAVSRHSMATGGLPGVGDRAAEVARLAVQFYKEVSKQK
ncbi:MAG: hypothetical protein AABY42_00785 [Nitrospirota bacterium]